MSAPDWQGCDRYGWRLVARGLVLSVTPPTPKCIIPVDGVTYPPAQVTWCVARDDGSQGASVGGGSVDAGPDAFVAARFSAVRFARVFTQADVAEWLLAEVDAVGAMK